MQRGVYVALDGATLDGARAMVVATRDHVAGFKVGLELFCAAGPDGVAAIRDAAPEHGLFLDLKLHDIPNTVAGAVRRVASLQPDLLTIHAGGGSAMIAAAAETAGHHLAIIAVTVLTSLDEQALASLGVAGSLPAHVERLARLAAAHGAAGVVCSAHEVTRLRDVLGPGAVLVVPGLRPAGVEKGDQARVMTPREAQDAGADVLVIGRPITAAEDPAAAAASIAARLA